MYYNEYLESNKDFIPLKDLLSDMKKSQIKNLHGNPGRVVICINTNEIFKHMGEACFKYGVNKTSMCMCCQGIRKSAGKHPETGEALRWMYYDDYIKIQENIASDNLKLAN